MISREKFIYLFNLNKYTYKYINQEKRAGLLIGFGRSCCAKSNFKLSMKCN